VSTSIGAAPSRGDGKETIVKIIAVVIGLFALHAVGVGAQSSSDLSSIDASKREEAARTLAAQIPLTADAKTTLVDLMAREKGLEPRFSSKASANDEGYAEYRGWLLDEVMKIADAEPDRTDVWRALLAADPGSGATAYGEWLGKHADKTLPFLLAYARDRRTDSLDRQNRVGSLESQIVAYERKLGTAHHLSSADVQLADSVIRDGLKDPDSIIRSASVLALSIIHDPQDIPVLENIALTDDDVIHGGGPTGTETVFPVRRLAQTALDRMRATLAAKPNAN
jgi:hypothetical protein